jgi:hypothetical protein
MNSLAIELAALFYCDYKAKHCNLCGPNSVEHNIEPTLLVFIDLYVLLLVVGDQLLLLNKSVLHVKAGIRLLITLGGYCSKISHFICYPRNLKIVIDILHQSVLAKQKNINSTSPEKQTQISD